MKVACGHTTADADAEEMIREVLAFFAEILADCVSVVDGQVVRGELYLIWKGRAVTREWAVQSPDRLCIEAREKFQFEEQP